MASNIQIVEVTTLCECIVCDLRMNDFVMRPIEEMRAILERGRPKPYLDISQPTMTYTRRFNIGTYDTFPWLTGCKTIRRYFCWLCLLFAKDEETSWNSTGSNDLTNLHKMCKRHGICRRHLEAHFREKRFRGLRKNLAVDIQTRDANVKHNEVVRRNRDVMRRLIDVICLLEQREFKQGEGNYVELIKLIAKYDPILSNHLEHNKDFRGTSGNVRNDLARAVADVVLGKIKLDIGETKYVSAVLHETTDLANRSHLSVVLRYAMKDGSVHERFTGFSRVKSDHTADSVYQIILDVLKQFDCEEKLVALSFDGACVAVGELSALQRRTWCGGRNIIFHHYYHHRLDIVLVESVSQIKDCKTFFETIKGMCAFFTKPKRITILNEQIKKQHEYFAPITWNFDGRMIKTIHKYRQSLINFFYSVIHDKNWDAETTVYSRGYLDLLSNDFCFNFILTVLESIFERANELADFIQESSDVDQCSSMIYKFETMLLEKRGQFDSFWQNCEERGVTPERKRQRMDGGNDKLSYKCLFIEIMDNISAQMSHRFRELGGKRIPSLVDFPWKTTISDKAVNAVENMYGRLFYMPSLQIQLNVLYNMAEINDLKECPKVLSFLIQNELDTPFFEVVKLCELSLALPISDNSDVLARVKKFVQDRAYDEQLSTKAIISIEKDLINALSRNPRFYDDVIDEFLKKDKPEYLMFK